MYDLNGLILNDSVSVPVFGILVLSALVLLPVLLPVAATDKGVMRTNTTSNGTFGDLDRLSMGHVQVSRSTCVQTPLNSLKGFRNTWESLIMMEPTWAPP